MSGALHADYFYCASCGMCRPAILTLAWADKQRVCGPCYCRRWYAAVYNHFCSGCGRYTGGGRCEPCASGVPPAPVRSFRPFRPMPS